MSRISVQLNKQDYINHLNTRIESLQQKAEELQKKIEEYVAEGESIPWYNIISKSLNKENIGVLEETLHRKHISISERVERLEAVKKFPATAKFTIEI